MSKQAISDKLQGCVATYLRCGGVVIDQIKKGSFLIDVYLAKLQAIGCLMHFARLANTLL